MNCDIFSVILSQLETMGWIPIGFLWIFFRKYSFEVMLLMGGLQHMPQLGRSHFQVRVLIYCLLDILVCFLLVVYTVGWVLIASINCELRVFLRFAIIRFANINVHVYYSTVQGRPSQLLDSQFGLT